MCFFHEYVNASMYLSYVPTSASWHWSRLYHRSQKDWRTHAHLVLLLQCWNPQQPLPKSTLRIQPHALQHLHGHSHLIWIACNFGSVAVHVMHTYKIQLFFALTSRPLETYEFIFCSRAHIYLSFAPNRSFSGGSPAFGMYTLMSTKWPKSVTTILRKHPKMLEDKIKSMNWSCVDKAGLRSTNSVNRKKKNLRKSMHLPSLFKISSSIVSESISAATGE